eukprot:6209230-Pleurochrysis_carterae.AAC.1
MDSYILLEETLSFRQDTFGGNKRCALDFYLWEPRQGRKENGVFENTDANVNSGLLDENLTSRALQERRDAELQVPDLCIAI